MTATKTTEKDIHLLWLLSRYKISHPDYQQPCSRIDEIIAEQAIANLKKVGSVYVRHSH